MPRRSRSEVERSVVHAAGSEFVELALGNGKIQVYPAERRSYRNDAGAIAYSVWPLLDGEPECHACNGRLSVKGWIEGGFLRVQQGDYVRVEACPLCAYGALRVMHLGIRFAPDPGPIPHPGKPCAPSHPARLEALAAMRKLDRTPDTPTVSDHLRRARELYAEGVSPEQILASFWWLPDRAKDQIRRLAIQPPSLETVSTTGDEDGLPF